MSEKLMLSHQPEQIRPNPAELQLGPETGAINFDGLAEAYHGARAFISQKRMERAGSRMERMDHKDALYADSVESLQSSNFTPTETATGQPAKPRNLVERFVDKRIERKDWKAGMKRAQRNLEMKQFGGERTRTMGSHSKIVDTARRHWVNQEYRNGNITAAERRSARANIDVTPFRVENPREIKLRKQQRSAERSAKWTANQPVLSRWRDMRRDRAIESIKKHHHNAQEHRQRQADARS